VKPADRDAAFMARALRLAARGRGRVSPNPMVGALVVAGGRIVGQGWHRRPGEPHAEVLALRAAGPRARGATLYVTLEPCCHEGKRTPPCVPTILASGVRRVVVAMRDPNPLVSGRGLARLRRAGLAVSLGCRREEAERLNLWYGHRMRTGRPYVILKAAMTLDGKIATASGESRWITGEAARRDVHRLRARVDAILVGVNTVLRDDPRLTVRPAGDRVAARDRHPLRVVLDSRLRIPPAARVLAHGPGRAGVLVVTTRHAPARRRAALERRGGEVLVLPAKARRVPLRACLEALGRRGVTSLLVEGGGEVHASFLREGLADEVRLYVAPRLLGGTDAVGLLGGRSPRRLADAVPLATLRVGKVGHDLLIEGRPLAGAGSSRSPRQ
jgi:diaminohydroxyphosphoribosylaminopyrimidine deaminase/5-amino-6-(5-phosphoribosylamino)uracil reductase